MPMKNKNARTAPGGNEARCKRCGGDSFRDTGMTLESRGVVDFRACTQCGALHPSDTDSLQIQAHQRWFKMGMFDALRGMR
jgi:hypothetical protein